MYKMWRSRKKYTFVFIIMFISICALFANRCSTVNITPIVFPINTQTNPVFTPNIVFPTNTVAPTIVPGHDSLLPFPMTEEYCSALCPEALIGDGTCDPFCNNANCSYDGGDCPNMSDYTKCSIFCFNSQIGDGMCDPFCYNEYCNYDGGDCK